jgi:hypothetical protein
MKTRIAKTFFLIPFLALADEPAPGQPSLGWMLNAARTELLRLDGVPGSLSAAREALEPAGRSWISSGLLLQLRGETLQVRDLRSGETRLEAWTEGQELVFSPDGKRFAAYGAGEATPFLANDGSLHRIEGALAYAQRDGALAAAMASGEIGLFTRNGEGWSETQRVAPPVQGTIRSLHWSGEMFYLLTRDGDLYSWREGEAEAVLLASEVRSFTPLAALGFFEIESGAGPQLFYPASPGQKLYALPGAKAAVQEGVAQ